MTNRLLLEAIDLYESGLTLAAVGRELGISDTTVSKMLSDAGIKRRKSHGGANRAKALMGQRPRRPKHVNTVAWTPEWHEQQNRAFLVQMAKHYPEHETPPADDGRYPMWRPRKTHSSPRVGRRRVAESRGSSSLDGIW